MAYVTDFIRQLLSGASNLMQQQAQGNEMAAALRAARGKPDAAEVARYAAFPTLAMGANTTEAFDAAALKRQLARSGEQAAGLFEVFGGKDIAASIRKDPSSAAMFFQENGGAMPLLAAMAKQGGKGVNPAEILKLFPEGIRSPEEERIVREALLAGGTKAADVENIVEGHRAGGPMPTIIQSGQRNVGIDPYGRRVEQIGGTPIGGPRTPPASVNINTPVNIAGNALEARRQFYQEVKPLQMGLDKIAQARGSLALARTGNAQAVRTLITNVEQAIQPTSAVLESEFARTREFGSLPTRLENWIGSKVTGKISDTTLDEIEQVLDELDNVTRQGIESRRQGYAVFEQGFGASPGMVSGGLGVPPTPEPPPETTREPQGRVERHEDGTIVIWEDE